MTPKQIDGFLDRLRLKMERATKISFVIENHIEPAEIQHSREFTINEITGTTIKINLDYREEDS